MPRRAEVPPIRIPIEVTIEDEGYKVQKTISKRNLRSSDRRFFLTVWHKSSLADLIVCWFLSNIRYCIGGDSLGLLSGYGF